MNGRAFIQLWLVVLMFVGLVQGACAQERLKYDYSVPQTSRYVKEHAIDVDDMPEHKLRIVEIQRVYSKDHPRISGVKVLEQWQRAFTNYVSGNGPVIAYETWLMEDGNRVYVHVDAHTTSEVTPEGFRRGVSQGTNRIVGGTGRFASLRGQIVVTVEFNSDPKNGYNRPSGRGEYWYDK